MKADPFRAAPQTCGARGCTQITAFQNSRTLQTAYFTGVLHFSGCWTRANDRPAQRAGLVEIAGCVLEESPYSEVVYKSNLRRF